MASTSEWSFVIRKPFLSARCASKGGPAFGLARASGCEWEMHMKSRDSGKRAKVVPLVEPLEDRTAPALISSQIPLATLPPLTLTTGQVKQLIQRAAAATSSDDAIVAVVDRMGNILGVRVEGNVSSESPAIPPCSIFPSMGQWPRRVPPPSSPAMQHP